LVVVVAGYGCGRAKDKGKKRAKKSKSVGAVFVHGGNILSVRGAWRTILQFD
jgi:hypothetical protein